MMFDHASIIYDSNFFYLDIVSYLYIYETFKNGWIL